MTLTALLSRGPSHSLHGANGSPRPWMLDWPVKLSLASMLAFASAALLASPASSQSLETAASSATLTLAQALSEAERANPEILAAKRRWDAARRRVSQAATPDKPRLDLERMYAPSGTRLFSADEKAVAVSQEIPFPTSLYYRGRVASSSAAMAEQAVRAKVREVLARVRSAYSMLLFSERGLHIAGENVDLMRRFSKVAEAKYAAGRTGQSDALKAQVELTRMLNMRSVMEQDRDSARALLVAALGRQADAPLALPAEFAAPAPLPELDQLEAAALSDRPELREAALGVERGARSLSLARSELLPDIMLQYRRRRDSMRGTTQDGMVGFSLPLWFWRPAAMISEAKAEKEMAEAELDSMRLMTLSDLRSAYVRAETARRLAEVYRTSVLPQAEAALNVAESGYRADKSSFLDLLDAQRSLLEFRLEYYQYQAEHQARLADLERATGRGLP